MKYLQAEQQDQQVRVMYFQDDHLTWRKLMTVVPDNIRMKQADQVA